MAAADHWLPSAAGPAAAVAADGSVAAVLCLLYRLAAPAVLAPYLSAGCQLLPHLQVKQQLLVSEQQTNT